MRKSHLNLLLTGITALFLLSACSEESSVSQDDKINASPEPGKVSKTEEEKIGIQKPKNRKSEYKTGDRNRITATDDSESTAPVMNEPVDFSTPENMEKTVARIRSEGGDAALNDLKKAMTTIWRSDTTQGKTKAALYEKMNGKTPNEIIKLAKQ